MSNDREWTGATIESAKPQGLRQPRSPFCFRAAMSRQKEDTGLIKLPDLPATERPDRPAQPR